MAVEFNLKGCKNARQVVKTIDISEQTYQAITKMAEKGTNVLDSEEDLPFLSDIYNVFGGNCYGDIVSMAIKGLIANVVDTLDDKGWLIVEGQEAFMELSEAFLPLMCSADDETLHFFGSDEEEIRDAVRKCIIKDKADEFIANFNKAIENDTRPVGEIATGILMYVSSEEIAEDDVAN